MKNRLQKQFEPGSSHAGATSPGSAPTPEDASQLVLLSDRLLSDLPAAVWRQLFLSSSYDTIRFVRGTVTFLCADQGAAEWSEQDMCTLARRHTGYLECFGPCTMLAFADPDDALCVAVLLQRASGSAWRICLLTTECTAAYFEVDGCNRRLTVGDEAATAAALVDRAPPGTIHLSAETYEALGDDIERHARGGLLTTEIQDEVVTSAAITLAPPRESAMSTFAGLGLT